MQPELQSRVVVVLVRARNPSNIGAVARAMHDLGYTHLRIVNEYPVPFAAAKSAVDASSVLDAATEHTSLADALADCTLVLGTTAVGERVLEHPLYLLPQAAPVVAEALATPEARVALLFGSEKTGLSNDELSHCHALVTIPMNDRSGDRHLSMNLGQAAAVCLYQLALEPAPAAAPDPDPPASAAEVDRIHGLFREVLDDSGYSRRHPANSREAATRRLVLRMALTSSDATVWSGILRQLLHAVRK
ncbi:RNA methyltransferase [Granulicella sp. WH15]|uniref:RNA methyltransferase n=1 Tax=Granulicella sp. WH15 TaxID=2602070 RepID=UPI001366F48D|nr:TrmH family RNA methyltransferase [Granulicella sp. WH15]QHN02016.1 RNA methyltransferase [Granulicella sp. WH15]